MSQLKLTVRRRELMAKIILEFDSNDDWIESQIAINAGKLQGIIWDLDQKFRSLYKYEGVETIGTSDVRKLLGEIMNEHGINFDHEIFT